MASDNRKRDGHERSVELKHSMKRGRFSSTTLFPAELFGSTSTSAPFMQVKQEDLETEKDGSTTDCEYLTMVKSEDNIDGYITDTDTTAYEFPNSRGNEKGINYKNCSSQYLSTPTEKSSLICKSVSSTEKDILLAESKEKNDKVISPKKEKDIFSLETVKKEKDIFSLETAKYFNVNGCLSVDDITSCLEYLHMTFGPTSHFDLSSVKSEAKKVPNMEQNTSSSSAVMPQNNLIKTPKIEHLEIKPVSGTHTICKASRDNIFDAKVSTFEKVSSNIFVSKSSSIAEPENKLDKQIIKKDLSKISKSVTAPICKASPKVDSTTCKQNVSVMVENAKPEALMKRKPETCEKSLLTSKKVKRQHSSAEMSNRLSTDSVPITTEISKIQISNPHPSQFQINQMADVRDPRLRKNASSKTNGYQLDSKRVATNFKQVFLNEPDTVGPNQLNQDFIPTHQEMPFCILDWDPKWLMKKNDIYPPLLGDFRPPLVKDIYTSKDEYSKTYCSIHLLSIWQAIHYSFKSQAVPKTYKCNVQNVEEVRSYFKNECISLMPFNDIPKLSSIILLAWHSNGTTKNCFAYVYEIRPTAAHRASQDSNSSSEEREICKIKFYCYTTQKIENYKKISVVIQRLCRVRVYLKQYEALCLPENSDLSECIINPFRNAHKIKAVILPSNKWMDHIKDFVKEWQSKIAVTLLLNLNNNEILIILTLVRYLMTRSTILICMRDMGKFLKIAKQFENRCILAVKESEVSIPREIHQHTIRSKARELCKSQSMSQEKAELQILKQYKIILTLVSSMYFSDTTAPVLGSNLICIIDDAHKCTEADTALPLSFNPANVFLLGDSSQYPHLDPRQQRLMYNTTLFHRLLKHAS